MKGVAYHKSPIVITLTPLPFSAFITEVTRQLRPIVGKLRVGSKLQNVLIFVFLNKHL